VLEQIFSSQARVAIMKLFLLNPDDRYYLRQAASLTGQPVRAVEREVAKLEAVGLLFHTLEGNRKYYQVDNECPIFPELKSVFLKTVGLGDVLREHMEGVEGAIEVAFVYGSYARGEETSLSDIDLFVIGSVSGRELSSVLTEARSELAREINPVMMTAEEFASKVASGNHFVLSILDDSKTFLVGNAEDLESLAGRGKAQGT
jgi:predicted nucleotidyltransferase